MVNADPTEAPVVPEAVVSQGPVNDAQDGSNTAENGTHQNNSDTNGYNRNGETLLERQERLLARWETFPVEYNGRGIVYDSDDSPRLSSECYSSDDNEKPEGYARLSRRRYVRVAREDGETITSSSSSSDSESDMEVEDGPAQVVDPVVEPVIEQFAQPVAADDPGNYPMGNDIPLDEEKVNTIRAAMANFTIQPPPGMPDDSKLLEMVKNMSEQ